jgi:hypothetical protein
MVNMDKIKMIHNGAYYFYKYVTTGHSEKQLLDPFTTILKLSVLNFKQINTKLSIHNHKIYYQEPTLYQGASRKIYGDKRGDLHNIHEPIIKCLDWYDKSDERIHYIYSLAKKGLENLKESYLNNSESQSDLVIHSIDLYIKILKACLDDVEIEDDVMSKDMFDDKHLVEKFQSLWSDKDINVVYNLLLCIEDKQTNSKDYDDALTTLETFLNGKDTDVFSLIKQMSTSFGTSPNK